MESVGGGITLLLFFMLIFGFSIVLVKLVNRIFGPVLGTLILLVITFGMYSGGDDS